MTKSEYMQALQEKLQRYNGALQQEILEDYEQHFTEGMAEGRSEEEIIAELGNIDDMLQEISEEDLKQELAAVSAQASQSGSYEQVYKAIVIEGLLADVEVSASEDDQLRVNYDNRGNKAQKLRYCFYQYEEEGVFYAGVKESKEGFEDMEGFEGLERLKGLEGLRGLFSQSSWSGCNIKLSLQIPSKISVVKLHTTSGDLDIEQIQTKELEAQCTSGDLRIENVFCNKLIAQTFSGDMEVTGLSASDVDMQSASGDMSADRLQGEKLRLQTASGEMELNDIEGKRIRLGTGSGEIDGRDIRGGELTATTGSGEVSLECDVEDCEIKTGSGSIDLEAYPHMQLIRLSAGSGDVSLDLGRVEGATISVRANSGDMVIRGYEVSGHSYNCSYGSGSCQVEIRTASGDIEVE